MSDYKPENTNLEVYRTYVDMTDRFSARRIQIPITYFSILSALAIAMSFVIKEGDTFNDTLNVNVNSLLIASSFVGILLSFCWWMSIRHYRILGEIKYDVIRYMERQMFKETARPYNLENIDSNTLKSDTPLERLLTVPSAPTKSSNSESSPNKPSAEASQPDPISSEEVIRKNHLKKLTIHELILPIIIGMSFVLFTVYLIVR